MPRGLAPQTNSDEPPIPNYKYLSVPEVLEKVNYLTREQVEQVQRFESRHRKRKTLLTKLTRMLREPADQPRPPADENE